MNLSNRHLQELCLLRLQEAWSLHDSCHWHGCYYLAGYTVELALKAIIAQNVLPNTLPQKRFSEQIYTHDLRQLRIIAELNTDYQAQASRSTIFRDNWDVVEKWNEQTRYILSNLPNYVDVQIKAERLLEVLTDDSYDSHSSPNGVLPWLAQYWR